MQPVQDAQKHGFSLIELTIVLSLIALLLAISLAVGAARIEAARLRTTQERLVFIADSLDLYFEKYGHLPCPSSGALTTDDADYGNGIGSGVTGCSNVDAVVAMDGVLGAVPFRQLGIAAEAAKDGWDRRFTYAVDTRATSTTEFDALGDTVSVLEVRKTASATSIPALVLIMSHGQNGQGAWPAKGGTQITVSGLGADELENADDDERFVQKMPEEDFDDISIYRQKWQFDEEE